MYLLAALCLFTAHAAEDMKYQIFLEKYKAAAANIRETDEFDKCFLDARWTYYPEPSEECDQQEYLICGVTNSEAKQFLDGLDQQEKEWAMNGRKVLKETCKTAMKTMKNCHADCEKIYPSSGTTLSFDEQFQNKIQKMKAEELAMQLQIWGKLAKLDRLLKELEKKEQDKVLMEKKELAKLGRLLGDNKEQDKVLMEQALEKLEKDKKNALETMEKNSRNMPWNKTGCVKSLSTQKRYLHAEFYSENEFDFVQSGQTLAASCQIGYEPTGPVKVMYKCTNVGIWFPVDMTADIQCFEIANNGVPYAVSLAVWFLIAALN